jgi:hypothetical protein
MVRVSEQGNAGRYARTTNGLIASLVVTVLAVGAFVALRAFGSDDLEVRPEPVDYLSVVDAAQDAGIDVVYPPTLPRGWEATSVDYAPGGRLDWGIGTLTDDGKFAGVRQADDSVDDLLDAWVDADPVEGDPIEVPGAVVRQWRSWSDSGGDHAFSAELGDTTVLVFGSASVDDLRDLLGRLTLEHR